MRVLIGCEFSGVIREEFATRGHQAVSCDLLPTTQPGLHYQGDVRDLLDGWQPVHYTADCDPEGDGWCETTDRNPDDCQCIGPTQDGIEYKEMNGVLLGRPEDNPHWDLLIAHPPCTYLSYAGTAHWDAPGRLKKRLDALHFFAELWLAPINRICLENPKGCASPTIAKYTQEIHPYFFGDSQYKRTLLWLKNLPPLVSQEHDGLFQSKTFTDKPEPIYIDKSGKFRHFTEAMSPHKDRSGMRATSFRGIAAAMAEQWGNLDIGGGR